MIEQLHVDQSEGLLNLKGSEPVVKAGFEVCRMEDCGQGLQKKLYNEGQG
jgi:hypothetical protein